MKIGVLVDSNGFYISDFLEGMSIEGGQQWIPSVPVDGFYKPRWNDTQWVEGLTQTEIDALRNAPQPPTAEERLKATEDAISALMGV